MIKYKKYLKKYARERRQNQTLGEMKLWSKLRNKQLIELKFKRQQPIDRYVVDFYCRELNLVIEIDGSSHDEKHYTKDLEREKILRHLGLQILRFSESDVIYRIDEVLQSIVNLAEGKQG